MADLQCTITQHISHSMLMLIWLFTMPHHNTSKSADSNSDDEAHFIVRVQFELSGRGGGLSYWILAWFGFRSKCLMHCHQLTSWGAQPSKFMSTSMKYQNISIDQNSKWIETKSLNLKYSSKIVLAGFFIYFVNVVIEVVIINRDANQTQQSVQGPCVLIDKW